jgi:hypothetical protein
VPILDAAGVDTGRASAAVSGDTGPVSHERFPDPGRTGVRCSRRACPTVNDPTAKSATVTSGRDACFGARGYDAKWGIGANRAGGNQAAVRH